MPAKRAAHPGRCSAIQPPMTATGAQANPPPVLNLSQAGIHRATGYPIVMVSHGQSSAVQGANLSPGRVDHGRPYGTDGLLGAWFSPWDKAACVPCEIFH